MSDVDIISLSLCAELFGFDSERFWFNFVKSNFTDVFPKFCDRTRFNRIKRNLTAVTDAIIRKLTEKLPQSDLAVIDGCR
ncbi:MAG: hypothetical protein LBP62_04085 [Clostridiales bacterium]|jgi:hypothetical protein|nr:hypothetical protein [Clostridiales bacterium]